MTSECRHGPSEHSTNRDGAGFLSTSATRIELGEQDCAIELPGLGGVQVEKGQALRYFVFPEQDEYTGYTSTFVAVDLVFRDGTRLSERGIKDQYGTLLTAMAQGASKMLFVDQWNHVEASLDECVGLTVERAELVYAAPVNDAEVRAVARFSAPVDALGAQRSTNAVVWIETPAIIDRPENPTENDFSSWVDTRRGTHSSGDFSRGNNLPITAWPNGFCFWAPVVNARTQRWPYEYHRLNGADNRPRLQGIGISHQPSPWMGDRNQLFFMPGVGPRPIGDPEARALGFDHEHEEALPHQYSVPLDNGLRFAVAPTDHGGVIAITLDPYSREVAPDDPELLHLVVDSLDNDFGVHWDGNTLTGWVDNGEDDGRVRMFFAAEASAPAASFGEADGGLAHARALSFDPNSLENGTLYLRVATSFIGVEQATRNLELELLPGVEPSSAFTQVLAAAHEKWNERLSVVQVEDATEHQLRTLYGCLYRMNLYPNSSHENIGTAQQPRWVHASSVLEKSESTATRTGAQVVDGITFVNNGFWDTYRTIWPALSLLYPQLAAHMIEGFIQQYREGGWVARWSSPGYADLMTGTSSDVAFADAYVRGVPLVDEIATYEAGLKNATVVPPNPAIGRKGMVTSTFTGYVDSRVDESVSWALEGYINDFGLANQAELLAKRIESGAVDTANAGERAARLREDAAYLRARAANFRLLFDEKIGFFQGRALDGTFTQSPEEFDPCVWGGDFTETDGWNFAFHAAHDPEGLANLYGGTSGLKAKLDEFFSTPETALKYGTYGFSIHEMWEAQAVRMGQYGFSNQPAHHIAHMYNYAGDVYATQAIVHEVLRRLFVGEQIGQGYPGDEDNGEMSAWYVLNALGIYPLRVGSPEWALGSPLYRQARVRPLGGDGFDVIAKDWTPESVYVSEVAFARGNERRSLAAPSINHDDLLGATLEFTMVGERPTPSPATGYGSAPAPSLTPIGTDQKPLRDYARSAAWAENGESAPALVDDAADTVGPITAGQPLEVTLDEPVRPRFITLTSGTTGGDPTGVSIEGRQADGTWITLRANTPVSFRWRQQTIPFMIDAHADIDAVRMSFDAAESAVLAQVEVLA